MIMKLSLVHQKLVIVGVTVIICMLQFKWMSCSSSINIYLNQILKYCIGLCDQHKKRLLYISDKVSKFSPLAIIMCQNLNISEQAFSPSAYIPNFILLFSRNFFMKYEIQITLTANTFIGNILFNNSLQSFNTKQKT